MNNVDVLCNNQQDSTHLVPLTQEEADCRIFLHLKRTYVQRLNLAELCISFGVGKIFRFFAAHEIAQALSPDKYVALPMFHAVTRCDTVSFFGGRGKKTAWDTWKVYQDVTPAFCAIMTRPTLQTIEEWLWPLERFVVLLYDRTSSLNYVSEAKMQLFTQKGRAIDGLPPPLHRLLSFSI